MDRDHPTDATIINRSTQVAESQSEKKPRLGVDIRDMGEFQYKPANKNDQDERKGQYHPEIKGSHKPAAGKQRALKPSFLLPSSILN